jgi:HAMP domain-containing protein
MELSLLLVLLAILLLAVLALLSMGLMNARIEHLHEHVVLIEDMLFEMTPDDDDPDEIPARDEPETVVAMGRKAA